MTNAEAIETIKQEYYAEDCCLVAELAPALEMAIDALNKQNWIPVSERMPEEHKWIGTESFGTTISDEVYVTFETPKGERFVKHLAFQNGGLSRFDQQTIDAFFEGSVPIAWMPLPEPYKECDTE